MRILFDNGAPRPLRRYLEGHSVDTAYERGWAELSNGDLLDHAEGDGYELLLTGDQSLRHQQNLRHRRISIVVLRSNRWPIVRLIIDDIRNALERIQPGEVIEVPMRHPRQTSRR